MGPPVHVVLYFNPAKKWFFDNRAGFNKTTVLKFKQKDWFDNV